MKALLTFAAAAASLCASAFHIQIGASGWSRRAQQWISKSMDIGATAGTLSSHVATALGETDYGVYYNYIPLGKRITTDSASWSENCYIRFPPGGGLTLYASTVSKDYTEQYGAKAFASADVVKLETFGYTSSWQNYAWDYGVVTMKGDPYSVVMNDTDTARTINGVEIAARDSASLPFPIFLVMSEVPNVKFYDLESGTEITCKDFASYGQSGVYYHSKGYYCPSWTGNIRISDGTTAATNAPYETFVYGDMVAANTDKLLYSTNGMPVRSAIVNITTNIALNTWWDFTQSEWGSSPQAMINGEVVCSAHSTSHIISYTVNANNLKINTMTGRGYVYFTMSQAPGDGSSGGGCVMRCWDAAQGSSTSGYANTPADHKAEISAGLGVARFKMTIDIFAGTWKVEPN